MNSNKNIYRSSRLQAEHPRSSTPKHHQMSKSTRISHSQSKPPPTTNLPISNPLSKLTPIAEQLAVQHPYYLGRGNNHQLIKRILERRKGWGQVQNNTDASCFRWVQTSFYFKFHLLGKQCLCFNHFEYHRELSNKERLVKNLINFCESNKLNVYSFIPVTFILNLNTGEEGFALHAFIKFFNRNYPDESTNRRYQTIILPKSKYTPYFSAQQLNKRSQGNFYCKPFCSKSFIDGEVRSYLWILKPTFLNRGRGVVLFKQLNELQKLIWKYFEGEGLEDYADKHATQIFKDDKEKDQVNEQQDEKKQNKIQPDKDNMQNKMQEGEDKEQGEEKEKEKQKEKEQQQKKNQQEPHSQPDLNKDKKQDTQVNQGSPCKISNNNTSNSRCMSFIIQKYIEKPMLIDDKKFDIRFYALLTHEMQVYAFDEGYLRFSSQPYSTKDNHTNPFIHLTNNSVQKFSQTYDKDSGNQNSLSSIKNYLPPNKAESIFKSIVQKMKEIIWISMCSVRRKINVNSRKQCFQLFGYDFMIDNEYKVWLIQVNTNPSLDQSGPLLRQILPRMIDDMFKLTIDKIFNNTMKDNIGVLEVNGVENNVNMWELLGDIREGGHKRKAGMGRSSIQSKYNDKK